MACWLVYLASRRRRVQVGSRFRRILTCRTTYELILCQTKLALVGDNFAVRLSVFSNAALLGEISACGCAEEPDPFGDYNTAIPLIRIPPCGWFSDAVF